MVVVTSFVLPSSSATTTGRGGVSTRLFHADTIVVVDTTTADALVRSQWRGRGGRVFSATTVSSFLSPTTSATTTAPLALVGVLMGGIGVFVSRISPFCYPKRALSNLYLTC